MAKSKESTTPPVDMSEVIIGTIFGIVGASLAGYFFKRPATTEPPLDANGNPIP